MESLNEYAHTKAPECVCSDKTGTYILVVEQCERILHKNLTAEVAIDVFDSELKPMLVLVLHEEYLGSTKITLEDEDFLRRELHIEEKGKWYRYFGAFHTSQLENYKKRVSELGSYPSRATNTGKLAGECQSNDTSLSSQLAAVNI